MLALPPLPERDVLLLTPSFHVSTGQAYSWLDATSSGQLPSPVAIPLAALSDWNALAACAENDFEVPVTSRHPEIAEMLAALSRAGALVARMSGSGSTVFGVFSDAALLRDFAGDERWEVRRTRSLGHVVPAEVTE